MRTAEGDAGLTFSTNFQNCHVTGGALVFNKVEDTASSLENFQLEVLTHSYTPPPLEPGYGAQEV